MTIIRVTPEILVMTSQRMTQVNGEIQAAVRDLSSVLNGIGGEYGGQLRNQVAPRVGQAQGAASGPTNQVNTLTLELNKRAQLFATADGQSLSALSNSSAQLKNLSGDGLQFDLFTQLTNLPALLQQYLKMGGLLGSTNWQQWLETNINIYDKAKLVGGVLSAIYLMKVIPAGRDIVNISGGSFMRWLTEVPSKRVGMFRVGNFMAWDQWANLAVKPLSKVSKLALLDFVLSFGNRAWQDWNAYQSAGISKLTSALVVDAWLTAFTSFVVTAASLKIGYIVGAGVGAGVVLGAAALGVAVSPAIIVVGGVIGALVVAGIASDLANKYLFDQNYGFLGDRTIHDAAVDTLDSAITWSGEYVGNAMYSVYAGAGGLVTQSAKLGNRAASAVDNTLSDAVNAVQNAIVPRLAPTW
ncbi:MAG: hypothetical protein BroJett039_06910 [Chloroflexota bacterium]|nr:MAG: hypothetical protein BroJett039_06910 [Chloroflexota bacterium]